MTEVKEENSANKYELAKNNFFTIGGIKVHAIQIPQVIEIMAEWIKNKAEDNYIVVSNANDAVLSSKDPSVKEAVNQSSLSVPDGFSMVLLGRIRGFKLKDRVYGPDLMRDFLEYSQGKEIRHFFFGSTEQTLEKLIDSITSQFDSVKIAGTFSPPFRERSEEEKNETINMLNNANADVLWVGLGCPKQQLWMHETCKHLNIPVSIGVGAAFDFLAGTKVQAPKWMQKNGLEWFFRLITEPKRLWKRYLIGNFIFLILCVKELFNGNKKHSVTNNL